MLTATTHETGLGIGARETEYGLFRPARFEFTAALIVNRAVKRGHAPCADKLAVLMFLADMDAYRTRGESITKATWVRGATVPWCREMGEHWLHGFVLSIPSSAYESEVQ